MLPLNLLFKISFTVFNLSIYLCLSSCTSTRVSSYSSAQALSTASTALTARSKNESFSEIQSQTQSLKAVDRHCYLNSFHPQNFPWPASDCLNIEEVFKNYQFDEATWDEKNKVLNVKHFKQGTVESSVFFIYKEGKLYPKNP